MQTLGLLFAIILLGVGLVLNAAVLCFFLVRSLLTFRPLRRRSAAQQALRLAVLPR